MPYPTQPSLTLSRLSDTGFQANVTGADNGTTLRLFYRRVGDALDTTGPTAPGPSASLTVSGLQAAGQYTAFVVADSGAAYSLPSYGAVSLASGDLLTTAVHAQWNSFPALVQALPGGLWTGEVPQGTAPPYATLDCPQSSTPLFEAQWDFARAQFRLWAVGAAAAEACGVQVKAAFDYCSLPFQSAQTVSFVPRSYRLVCEMARYKDAGMIWRLDLGYEAHVQRSRNLANG